MTALLATVALFTGLALGFFVAALMASGRREDDCRRCRRAALDQAFREADGESYGGSA